MLTTDYFAVLSHKTGIWYHHQRAWRDAKDQAEKFSRENPSYHYDVIRLYGNIFEEHNKELPPEQHLFIPRQNILITYGPQSSE